MMRALVLILLAGCGAQLREARAIQPNPALQPPSAERLPQSAPLSWFTYANQIPNYWQLRSTAQFSVLSPDRIRAHLTITRYDEREASSRSWRVWLEDDSGRRIEPVAEEPQLDRLHLPWRVYPRYPGQFVRERAVPGWTVYAGRRDYVFTAPGLLAPDRKFLSLVAERAGYQMRFTWEFREGAPVRVEYYGLSKGYVVMVAPGPDTELAETVPDNM